MTNKTNKLLFTNPNIFIVQSKLYASAYATGNGKWVIFNPSNRKAFLAVGKDRLPDIVLILSLTSKHPVSEEYLTDILPSVSPKQIQKLINADLLRYVPTLSNTHPKNFIQRYHLATFNYPFHDYSNPKWREQDLIQMRQYAHISPPPSKTTERFGEFYQLPSISIEDIHPNLKDDPKSGKLQLRNISAILKFVFGSIAELPGGEFGPWMHKTSPSGGARHPTEGLLILSENHEGIPSGIYAYDVERHGLVNLSEEYNLQKNIDALGKNVFGFIIRSRVERAMWRYREIRSFRPLILDAGHIVETLSLLLGLWGLSVRVESPSLATSCQFSWLVEPEIAVILAGQIEDIQSVSLPIYQFPLVFDNKVFNEPYLTNPSMYITFEDGSLAGYVLWPEHRRITIDFVDFNILTHCLPSFRGDRITTLTGILEAFPDTSVKNIERLCENNALISGKVGNQFYKGINLWSRYGWYLSLIAHLENQVSLASNRNNYSQKEAENPHIFSSDELVSSLIKRKTIRAFSSEFVKKKDLEELLSKTCDTVICQKNDSIRLLVAALSIEGLESGLYEWDIQTRNFRNTNLAITREEIRNLTIGQEWSGSGAANLWLLRELNLEVPGTYEMDILELGRIGQRLCIAATNLDIGVFLTPAVSDSLICEKFNITKQVETIIYSFTVGYPRG